MWLNCPERVKSAATELQNISAIGRATFRVNLNWWFNPLFRKLLPFSNHFNNFLTSFFTHLFVARNKNLITYFTYTANSRVIHWFFFTHVANKRLKNSLMPNNIKQRLVVTNINASSLVGILVIWSKPIGIVTFYPIAPRNKTTRKSRQSWTNWSILSTNI